MCSYQVLNYTVIMISSDGEVILDNKSSLFSYYSLSRSITTTDTYNLTITVRNELNEMMTVTDNGKLILHLQFSLCKVH